MNQPRSIRHLLHTALLLLVLCGAGHIHSHVCLDGQEPAELVHFENLGGHPDHHEDDAVHADVENELMPQILLTKAPDQDSPLFLIAASLLTTRLQPPPRPHYLAVADSDTHHPPDALLPPSRAPPSYSV
jgi:hypothetical protein